MKTVLPTTFVSQFCFCAVSANLAEVPGSDVRCSAAWLCHGHNFHLKNSGEDGLPLSTDHGMDVPWGTAR